MNRGDQDERRSFADEITVLVNGALFAHGSREAIAADPRVRAVYLGESVSE